MGGWTGGPTGSRCEAKHGASHSTGVEEHSIFEASIQTIGPEALMFHSSLTCLVIGATLLTAAACRDNPTPERAMPKPRRANVPLVILEDTLAICRLESTAPLPVWAQVPPGEFFSATRTRGEQSIIIADARAPQDAKCERGWQALMVKGPLDFNQIGILAGLSGTLADAGISIFALSTYDTDYIMVKQGDLDRATAALRQAGYSLE